MFCLYPLYTFFFWGSIQQIQILQPITSLWGKFGKPCCKHTSITCDAYVLCALRGSAPWMVGGWPVGVWVGQIPQKTHQVAWYFLSEVLKCSSYVTVCIWFCWFSSLVWKVSLCRISISNRPFHRLRMSKVLGPTEVLEALHAKPMAMDLLLGFGFFQPSLILKQSTTWGMGTERISRLEVDRRGLSHQKFEKFFSPKNKAKVKWVKWASRITGSIFRSSTSALALQFFFVFVLRPSRGTRGIPRSSWRFDFSENLSPETWKQLIQVWVVRIRRFDKSMQIRHNQTIF